MPDVKFVYVTYIRTTPEKVWAALTDGEMAKDYWGRHQNLSDWNSGSPWSHVDCDSGIADVEGTVVEAEAPNRLVLTWDTKTPGYQTAVPSRVTFSIEPFMDAVKLTVIHEELDSGSPLYQALSQGWPAILSSLKTMLETGDALSMTKRRWHKPAK